MRIEQQLCSHEWTKTHGFNNAPLPGAYCTKCHLVAGEKVFKFDEFVGEHIIAIVIVFVMLMVSLMVYVGDNSIMARNAYRTEQTQIACDTGTMIGDNTDCYKAEAQYNTEYLCRDVTKPPFKPITSCWVEEK